MVLLLVVVLWLLLLLLLLPTRTAVAATTSAFLVVAAAAFCVLFALPALLCKAKRQQLLTSQVSSYWFWFCRALLLCSFWLLCCSCAVGAPLCCSCSLVGGRPVSLCEPSATQDSRTSLTRPHSITYRGEALQSAHYVMTTCHSLWGRKTRVNYLAHPVTTQCATWGISDSHCDIWCHQCLWTPYTEQAIVTVATRLDCKALHVLSTRVFGDHVSTRYPGHTHGKTSDVYRLPSHHPEQYQVTSPGRQKRLPTRCQGNSLEERLYKLPPLWSEGLPARFQGSTPGNAWISTSLGRLWDSDVSASPRRHTGNLRPLQAVGGHLLLTTPGGSCQGYTNR